MLVGAFGPWIKIAGILNTSVSGTDGSNDGWVVVVAAVVGAGGLLAYSRGKRLAGAVPLVAGIVGLATTVYDRDNVNDALDETESSLVAAQIGWGLNLALGASLVLAVVGLVALLGNQAAPGMKLEPEPSPKPGSQSTPVSEPVAPAPTTPSTSEEIERLADLNARGILTDEEFRAAKSRLLPTDGVTPDA